MEFLFSDTMFLANFQGLSTAIGTAVVVFLGSYFIKGISVDGPISALIAGIALAVVSFFLEGILNGLAKPLSWITLGLFNLVIDAIIIYVVHMLLKGFRVDNFGAAFLLALAITVVQYIF
jgi:putative membrane protein